MLLCAYLTVAGTGVSACIGGAATSAQFKLPNVVAMNGTSLYVVRLVFGDWLLCARADAPPSLYAERLQLRHDPAHHELYDSLLRHRLYGGRNLHAWNNRRRRSGA